MEEIDLKYKAPTFYISPEDGDVRIEHDEHGTRVWIDGKQQDNTFSLAVKITETSVKYFVFALTQGLGGTLTEFDDLSLALEEMDECPSPDYACVIKGERVAEKEYGDGQ